MGHKNSLRVKSLNYRHFNKLTGFKFPCNLFQWNKLLTRILATEKGVCMNYFLWFCSKKEDKYKYRQQNSEMKSRSVTNLGSKKGVFSNPYILKYVWSSSIYNFSFPLRKSSTSLVASVGASPMKISLHLLRNASWN